MKGILIIGMPGSGKSYIGKKVADILGFKFFDGDIEIEKKYPDRQRFLDTYGDKAYIDMEERIITKLPLEDSVLAPGGSIVYSSRIKQYFKNCFKVFLDASLSTIEKRSNDFHLRGVVRLKKLGLKSLYNERQSLYKNYADVIICAEDQNEDQLAKTIVSIYRLRQLSKK